MNPTDAALERRIAEADRLFRSAAQENHDWREFIERQDFRVGVVPPWWEVGVHCVWLLVNPTSLTSLNQETWKPESASDFVFQQWLAEYEEEFAARAGNQPFVEQWLARQHPAFVRYAVHALYKRLDDLTLNPPAEPAPTASTMSEPTVVENQPSQTEDQTQIPVDNTMPEPASAPTAENPNQWWVRLSEELQAKFPVRQKAFEALRDLGVAKMRISSKDTIRHHERGDYVPLLPTREGYATITGKSVEDIFGQNPKPKPKPPQESVTGDTNS
jgi:hypothetical protein